MSPLQELASRLGIVDAYRSQSGELKHTSDETRIDLLRAMGLPLQSERDAPDCLHQLNRAAASPVLPAVQVLCTVQPNGLVLQELALGTRASMNSRTSWRLTIHHETKDPEYLEGHKIYTDDRGAAKLKFEQSVNLSLGYHRLQLEIANGHPPAEGRFIVCPTRCYTQKPLAEPVWGVWSNLYSVNSSRAWGVGDTSSLSYLLRTTAQQGGAFVGCNPLHALRNWGDDISPYSPISRLYYNPLYIDVAAVPEFATCTEVQRLIQSPEFNTRLQGLRTATLLDYEAVMALKLQALRLLYQTFVTTTLNSTSQRSIAYRQFRNNGAERLDHFTQYAAREMLAPSHPFANTMQCFASIEQTGEFLAFLQFEIREQLQGVQQQARSDGMSIGVYQDLAVGSNAGSFDVWYYRDAFANHASVGAPPDNYAPQGQVWGLPPLNPQTLAHRGFEFFSSLVQAQLEHCGALRIDHVMGLSRLFWVPEGKSGASGAYVRYPSRELLGLIALESQRRKALIIGEDLGTVPAGFQELMTEWGILSSRVFCFEQEGDGSFKRAADYPTDALATANTHDMPPLRGYVSGRDLHLRRSVNVIPSDADLLAACEARRAEVRRMADCLVREGCIEATHGTALNAWLESQSTGALPDELALPFVAAVHMFLKKTPASLVGLGLDDLLGESEPVNLPGVGPEGYPSWRRRMHRTIECMS